MFLKIFSQLRATREHLGFLLTFVTIVGLFLICALKGLDTQMSIVTALAAYLGARSAEKISMVGSASKDPKANTHAIIRDLEGKEPHAPVGPPVDSPE